MDVIEFLPKYPNIDDSKYPVLNPYKSNFYEAIFQKKEFYQNRLDRVEAFPRERGVLTKYQQIITRYMSSHSPYDKILLVHAMGTGKTCSAVGAIEQIREERGHIFDGAIILAKGTPVLDNFAKELVEKCTPGQYLPENYTRLTEMERQRRIKKKIRFYQFRTFAKFAKKIKKITDKEIINEFSNKIIVIDEIHNLRIQEETKKESLEMYNQYHRFLHVVQNCKIMLLSGTPMKDSPEEIASVANLLLSLPDQLPTGSDFLDKYMEKKDNAYFLRPNAAKELTQKLKGKVSFLREIYSSVEKEYLGEKNFSKLNHFVVLPVKMSEFQSKQYAVAQTKDKSGKRQGVYINSREASLFVYPDGSYGRQGFSTYIELVKKKLHTLLGKKKTQKSYCLRKDLQKKLKGQTNEETISNIRKHSAIYADLIEKLLQSEGNCFVYSSLAKGSGAILLSLLLELVGFSRANGKEKDPSPRYGILTNKTSTSADIKRIISRYNQKDNVFGQYIKIIIGSRAISEGFSLNNVIFEAINTPHWNYSETAQAIARGIRLGSHNDLIAIGKTPLVKIAQYVSISDQAPSIDLFMYQTSEDKDVSIRNILRLLMEISFDCALNYLRNRVYETDGSRECDYTTCEYKCVGIDMQTVYDGLPNDKIDYSTYQLYYANPKIPVIRERIEQLFRQNNILDLDSIIENLKDEFSQDEIKNALFALEEEIGGKEFDYRTFLEIYSRTAVKKIIDEIELLFKEHFRLNLQTIVNHFSQNTFFEILTALRIIIEDNIAITNKYGLPSYLREENNVFFLVDSLTIEATFYSEYYVKHPHLYSKKNFSDIIAEINKQVLPKIVKKICKTKNKEEFIHLIKTLPKQVQEILIEASLVAKDHCLKNLVLDYFKSYITTLPATPTTPNVQISTLLREGEEILRCHDIGQDYENWHDCDEKYEQLLKEAETNQREKLRQENPYGIIGLVNPMTDAFCLLDLEEEKKAKRKTRGRVDKRLSYTGKVCSSGGWKITKLVDIVVNRLKIPPPANFLSTTLRSELVEKVKQDKLLSNIFGNDQIENAKTKTLRRALYWGTTKKTGGKRGIKPICIAIRNWLQKHDLIQFDSKCGVQGKRKIGTIAPTRKGLIIESIVPTQNESRFKVFFKDISRLMNECFQTLNYKPEIDDNIWIFVRLGKKLVGFIVMDTNTIIQNVCVARDHRRRDSALQIVEKAAEHIYTQTGQNPRLMVNNRYKNAKKLISMYTDFGFRVTKLEKQFTIMEYDCEK